MFVNFDVHKLFTNGRIIMMKHLCVIHCIGIILLHKNTFLRLDFCFNV